MNRQAFLDTLKGTTFFPNLTTRQTIGLWVKIDVWVQWYQERYPVEYLAASLTQIHHETGHRMQPVMETFASTPASAAQILERAFVKGQLPWVRKRYWLPDADGLIWIGRGDIQITHKEMYAKLRKDILDTFGVDIPLDENPELALDPVTSAVIAFEGMTKGLFRRRELGDYFKNGKMDYVAQRDIVNGDSADPDIIKAMKAGGALFEKALKAAGKLEATIPRVLGGASATTSQIVDLREERVKSIQRRLAAHGYSVGAIDGKYGPKTAKAVDLFESSRNIKLDHVDAATWEALLKPAPGEPV